MRATFETNIPNRVIVIGDPLCKNCYYGWFNFVSDYPLEIRRSKRRQLCEPMGIDSTLKIENLEMTPNSKLRQACEPLGIDLPPKMSKTDNKQVTTDSIDNTVSKIRTSLIKLFRAEEEDTLFKNMMPLKSLYERLKIKLSNTNDFSEKLQVLTLAPRHWTIAQCAQFFNVDEDLVKKASWLGYLEKPAP